MESRYRQLLKAVLRACQRPLEELGMKKRRISAYALDLSPRRIGTLGFNSGGEHGPYVDLRINPLVGATDILIDRLFQELAGLPSHKPWEAATVFTPIGYLMPQREYLEWRFSPDRPFEAEVQSMTDAIAEYGLPFMRAHDDLGRIIEKLTLRRPWGWPHVIQYTLPIALALEGRREEADEHMERKLREYLHATYPAAEQFRAFAARFSRWKPEEGTDLPP